MTIIAAMIAIMSQFFVERLAKAAMKRERTH
jgi:hypothetical protein